MWMCPYTYTSLAIDVEKRKINDFNACFGHKPGESCMSTLFFIESNSAIRDHYFFIRDFSLHRNFWVYVVQKYGTMGIASGVFLLHD